MAKNHPHSPQLTRIPPPLRETVSAQWQQYIEALNNEGLNAPVHDEFLNVLAQVWTASHFVAESCIHHLALLHDLLSSGDLLRDYTAKDYPANCRPALPK